MTKLSVSSCTFDVKVSSPSHGWMGQDHKYPSFVRPELNFRLGSGGTSFQQTGSIVSRRAVSPRFMRSHTYACNRKPILSHFSENEPKPTTLTAEDSSPLITGDDTLKTASQQKKISQQNPDLNGGLTVTNSNSRAPIPGPKPLPIVGNALDVIDTPLSELMLRYATRYGSFLKFSIVKDALHLISDPSALEYIHVTKSRNYLDRWTPPGFGPLLYDGRLRGLVFSQGRYWMQHRQLVASAFRSREFLSHFVNVASNRCNFLVENIWGSVSNGSSKSDGRTINIHQAMRMLTLDVIGEAAFGTNFNALRSGSHPIETALAQILHGVLDVIKTPVPLWRFMRTPGRAKIDEQLRTLQSIELDLIQKRRAELLACTDGNSNNGNTAKMRSDLLAVLLLAQDSKRGMYFSDDDLMWDVHDVIFAGHETTSSALAAAIWLISGSPRVLKKILEELDEVLPDGQSPTIDDLAKLKYLDMVFNEALRLYPPTALVGRIAKQSDVIVGYDVPAGANVLMSPYVMGRLERLWGEDVLEFVPERFAPDLQASRHPMIHTPFGAGPRICLGARMATMQAKVVLSILLRRVSFTRLSDDLIVDYDSTVSFKKGMEMLVKRQK